MKRSRSSSSSSSSSSIAQKQQNKQNQKNKKKQKNRKLGKHRCCFLSSPRSAVARVSAAAVGGGGEYDACGLIADSSGRRQGGFVRGGADGLGVASGGNAPTFPTSVHKNPCSRED